MNTYIHLYEAIWHLEEAQKMLEPIVPDIARELDKSIKSINKVKGYINERSKNETESN